MALPALALGEPRGERPPTPPSPAPAPLRVAALRRRPPSSYPAPRPIDPTPQRVLVMGDSMIHTLLPIVADHCYENGHAIHAGIWLGSTSLGWADGDKLDTLLPTFRPSYVVVVLGSSEVLGHGIDARIQRALAHLERRLSPRPMVWVGPLPWHPGKVRGERLAQANRGVAAVNAALRRTLGDGRHFAPSGLDVERAGDGIHPTMAGGRHWGERFVGWLREESAHPIALRPPTRPSPPPSITSYGAAWLPRRG